MTKIPCGIHLLSWDRLCMPKSVGGLGLIDLKLQNTTLLLKWLWRLYDNPDSQWSLVVRQLYGKRDRVIAPIHWNQEGSFFWKDLLKLRTYFQLFAKHKIKDGADTSFWFESWGISFLSYFGFHKHPLMSRKNIHMSLRDAIIHPFKFFSAPFTAELNSILCQAQQVCISEGRDNLFWNCNSDGHFSVASTYKRMKMAGKTRYKYENIWKLKTPPSLKHFLFYVSLGRILTQDQLLKRGIHINPRCYMCQQQVLEDAEHLFCQCVLAKEIWGRLRITSWATNSVQNMCQALHSCNSGLSQFEKTIICSAIWTLWKERNSRIFRDTTRTSQALHDWIVQEATLFMKFC
ncbi:RNA-directed DNA polymerase (reverse transcriptase)-related family protein [Rhynchospora pubera]|uniref:RNA-directed DNA polymerase (Reverse transcriptase)-related family protein n=1 Tax=Rhynchospora pubera TaxID=906938 RepID=A0AAV8EJ00_9POAL|nr:RNA-directed DNA polymerase (reverse transcriptase)-related family protein [Rhynchospora pubera]